PPTSTLFPYTSLFRSRGVIGRRRAVIINNARQIDRIVRGQRRDRSAEGRRIDLKMGAVAVERDRLRGRHRALELQPSADIDGDRDRKSTRLNSSHDQI